MDPKPWTSAPMLMSANEFVRGKVVEAEDNEVSRFGTPRPVVREALARKIGVAPGTIENLRRRRVKDLRGSIRDRIVAWVMMELHREIARLEHDLQVALLISDRPDADAVIEAQTALAKARKLIEQKPV